MKILVIANCQGRSIQTCLTAGRGDRVELFEAHKKFDGLTRRFLDRFDAIIIQNQRFVQSELSQLLKTHPRVINFPWLLFYGLTPDHCVLSPVAEITGKNTGKNTGERHRERHREKYQKPPGKSVASDRKYSAYHGRRPHPWANPWPDPGAL